MKEIMKKYRVIVAIIIYMILLGALFFVVSKIVSMINSSNDEIQKQELVQESKYKQIDDIPKKQAQFDEISLQKDKISGMLLKKEDTVKLIEQLENLAAQNKVEITIDVLEVQPDPKTKKAAPKKGEVVIKTIADYLPGDSYLKFTVDISGNYSDVFNFFSKIENMPYYSDIMSFDMKLNEEQQNQTSNTLDPFGNVSSSSLDASKKSTPAGPKPGDILGNFVIAFYLK